MTKPATRWTHALLALAAATLLAACGGGAGGEAVQEPPITSPGATPNEAESAADGGAGADTGSGSGTADMFMVDGLQFFSVPCAAEGGLCEFTGTRMVAFNAGSRFVVRSVTGPVRCDAATFGAAGASAHCHLGVTQGQEIADAPETATGDRSLMLHWTAPLTNDDGTPLTDLAGYRIYYGTRSGSYGASVAVNDPAALSHRLEALPPGTWYAMVKAVNRAGAQSIASPEVSKTIQ